MKPKQRDISKNPLAVREEAILDFWEKRNIFQKSVLKVAPKGDFVFYDGPPFANGLPHYGHIVASLIKDVIPRYKTMRGFRVKRRWGWDCHGLPVENLVEKELNLKTKKDIEHFGLKKFNAAARESVMRFASDWRMIIPRLGRWVDMDNDYRTMDSSYTESVWWAFKTLHEKNLIYQGFKPMHICPRCETTLSNFEVSQGYKDVTDISVYAKFELVHEPPSTSSGQVGTYLLAWTTTPWTLPGNVALAVGPDIDYSLVKAEGGLYILASAAVSKLFKGQTGKVLKEFKGKELLGQTYKPLFDYYAKDEKLKNRERGWKIYPAGFVSTEEGTGIVHIAPSFGEDDMKLGQEHLLPFVQHVGMNGQFKKEVHDFAHTSVKPKDDPQSTDIAIIKHLAGKNLLFSKEKIVHSYPHCWRCDTPLLNYAASSWFVKVTTFKDKLVAANKKVKWVPADIKEGRFGKWLEGARDWAISRSRFWGAPIPVWRCEKCNHTAVLGSMADLKGVLKSRNTYFLMRHGEAEHNVTGMMSSKVSTEHHLTEVGRGQALRAGRFLKDKKIDLIFASPFLRTQETMKEVCEIIGFDHKKIIKDARIGEINAGVFDGKFIAEYRSFFGSERERFSKSPKGGENYSDVRTRVSDFLIEIDRAYTGRRILIVTHDSPAWLLTAAASAMNLSETLKLRGAGDFFLENAEVRPLAVLAVPRNDAGELDLHRPYIDEISFACQCGGEMRRVPEVFDCWFESGSVPFAEHHYPFENLDEFNPKGGLFRRARGFPADFIAEGLDQTRGWFYSMMVLGVSLFGHSPYSRVIVNGTVLDEKGEQKLSKRLNNYPDPMTLVDRYSVDALRFYLLSSPAMWGQDICFSEKGVDEVLKKVITRLENVRAFFELYADDLEPELFDPEDATHPLDRWILARLREMTFEVTTALERYEIDTAARPITLFVDDLSTWYLRRSRDRFKSDDKADKQMALQTTRFVLLEFSKIIAPFTPFLAEDLYQDVKPFYKKGVDSDKLLGKESVHLEDWPAFAKASEGEARIIAEMQEVRKLVSLGLEARARAGIKTRQPLGCLKIKNSKLKIDGNLLALARDEVNVKEVSFDSKITNEVELDTNITPALKEEGQVRELIRNIQDLRKEGGLNPKDRVTLVLATSREGENFIKRWREPIQTATLVNRIEVVEKLPLGAKVQIDNLTFTLKLAK